MLGGLAPVLCLRTAHQIAALRLRASDLNQKISTPESKMECCCLRSIGY